jgi:hypothetical protein
MMNEEDREGETARKLAVLLIGVVVGMIATALILSYLAYV